MTKIQVDYDPEDYSIQKILIGNGVDSVIFKTEGTTAFVYEEVATDEYLEQAYDHVAALPEIQAVERLESEEDE